MTSVERSVGFETNIPTPNEVKKLEEEVTIKNFGEEGIKTVLPGEYKGDKYPENVKNEGESTSSIYIPKKKKLSPKYRIKSRKERAAQSLYESIFSFLVFQMTGVIPNMICCSVIMGCACGPMIFFYAFLFVFIYKYNQPDYIGYDYDETVDSFYWSAIFTLAFFIAVCFPYLVMPATCLFNAILGFCPALLDFLCFTSRWMFFCYFPDEEIGEIDFPTVTGEALEKEKKKSKKEKKKEEKKKKKEEKKKKKKEEKKKKKMKMKKEKNENEEDSETSESDDDEFLSIESPPPKEDEEEGYVKQLIGGFKAVFSRFCSIISLSILLVVLESKLFFAFAVSISLTSGDRYEVEKNVYESKYDVLCHKASYDGDHSMQPLDFLCAHQFDSMQTYINYLFTPFFLLIMAAFVSLEVFLKGIILSRCNGHKLKFFIINGCFKESIYSRISYIVLYVSLFVYSLGHTLTSWLYVGVIQTRLVSYSYEVNFDENPVDSVQYSYLNTTLFLYFLPNILFINFLMNEILSTLSYEGASSVEFIKFLYFPRYFDLPDVNGGSFVQFLLKDPNSCLFQIQSTLALLGTVESNKDGRNVVSCSTSFVQEVKEKSSSLKYGHLCWYFLKDLEEEDLIVLRSFFISDYKHLRENSCLGQFVFTPPCSCKFLKAVLCFPYVFKEIGKGFHIWTTVIAPSTELRELSEEEQLERDKDLFIDPGMEKNVEHIDDLRIDGYREGEGRKDTVNEVEEGGEVIGPISQDDVDVGIDEEEGEDEEKKSSFVKLLCGSFKICVCQCGTVYMFIKIILFFFILSYKEFYAFYTMAIRCVKSNLISSDGFDGGTVFCAMNITDHVRDNYNRTITSDYYSDYEDVQENYCDFFSRTKGVEVASNTLQWVVLGTLGFVIFMDSITKLFFLSIFFFNKLKFIIVYNCLREWFVYRFAMTCSLFVLFITCVVLLFIQEVMFAKSVSVAVNTPEMYTALFSVFAMFLFRFFGILSYDGPSTFYYYRKLIVGSGYPCFPDVNANILKIIFSNPDMILSNTLSCLAAIENKEDMKLKRKNSKFAHFDWALVSKLSDSEILILKKFFFSTKGLTRENDCYRCCFVAPLKPKCWKSFCSVCRGGCLRVSYDEDTSRTSEGDIPENEDDELDDLDETKDQKDNKMMPWLQQAYRTQKEMEMFEKKSQSASDVPGNSTTVDMPDPKSPQIECVFDLSVDGERDEKEKSGEVRQVIVVDGYNTQGRNENISSIGDGDPPNNPQAIHQLGSQAPTQVIHQLAPAVQQQVIQQRAPVVQPQVIQQRPTTVQQQVIQQRDPVVQNQQQVIRVVNFQPPIVQQQMIQQQQQQQIPHHDVLFQRSSVPPSTIQPGQHTQIIHQNNIMSGVASTTTKRDPKEEEILRRVVEESKVQSEEEKRRKEELRRKEEEMLQKALQLSSEQQKIKEQEEKRRKEELKRRWKEQELKRKDESIRLKVVRRKEELRRKEEQRLKEEEFRRKEEELRQKVLRRKEKLKRKELRRKERLRRKEEKLRRKKELRLKEEEMRRKTLQLSSEEISAEIQEMKDLFYEGEKEDEKKKEEEPSEEVDSQIQKDEGEKEKKKEEESEKDSQIQKDEGEKEKIKEEEKGEGKEGEDEGSMLDFLTASLRDDLDLDFVVDTEDLEKKMKEEFSKDD